MKVAGWKRRRTAEDVSLRELDEDLKCDSRVVASF